MKERPPAASMPKAWPRPRVGIHPRERYEGLVSIMSDAIGRGKGWVGGWGKQPEPIYTSREEPQRCRGCTKARAGSTRRLHKLLSPLISRNICSEAKECGQKPEIMSNYNRAHGGCAIFFCQLVSSNRLCPHGVFFII